ncbi:protein SEEDLING PLASTID DEVELOPMENT 1 [Silene latifolia]|uniref:protein SEEDLING PLASTID DEVELOPMENT 1 n=1 Tax=Silene latifolia TaxID=37657 RepID=UPI003D77D279
MIIVTPNNRAFLRQPTDKPNFHFPPKQPYFLHYPPTPNFKFNFIHGHPTNFPGIVYCCSGPSDSVPDDDELGRMLGLLPDEMRRCIKNHPEVGELIEVVLDLGRRPLARFPSGDFELSDSPITFQDLEFATSQVGDFAVDNRAGISRTLHRISAIRNRKDAIIGLTCRVGRAITGSADLLRDLVKDGASLLLIGPPGVGKTTIIREIARMLADECGKRVMIVDTSNEIGGDGDIPHAGIGNARRMQVPHSDMQHMVLIEAVENHMPQVIVIDEIGTKLEAMAASTISQRGIQLVATAHGITIDNLIKNPALDMLVGGIQSVTLGDEEASRRRVQKTVLERKGPPTFRCAVELISKTELRVHKSLQTTVDALLAGRCPEFEVRKMDFQGREGSEGESVVPHYSGETIQAVPKDVSSAIVEKDNSQSTLDSPTTENSLVTGRPIRIFVYGILEATIVQGIQKLNLDDAVELTDNISEADVLLALQSKLKKNLGIQAAAKTHEKPVYVTKTCSLVQVTKALRSLMTELEDISKDTESQERLNPSERTDALEEARIAIEELVIPEGETVELLPRPSYIVLLQAKLARKYHLQSEILGTEPDARLRILPLYSSIHGKQMDRKAADFENALEEFMHTNGNGNGSSHFTDRLPILPD